MSGALSHLVVAELCDDVPGASCGRQFAAWGARVVVVEEPGGSLLRKASPLATAGDGDMSLLWEHLAAGKECLAVHPGEANPALDRLLDRADIVVTDWQSHRLEAAGIPVSNLARDRVVVELSPFGKEGPYHTFQATDLVLQALSGFMVLNGLREREPLKAAGTMVTQAIGVSAFVAALAALHDRAGYGRGQSVEVACFEALASLVPLLRSEYSGADDVRQGAPISGTFMFECRDGFVSLNPNASRNWEDLMIGLGVDAQSRPPEVAQSPVDPIVARKFVAETLRDHSAEEVFNRLNELRIPCGLVNGPLELLRDRHLRARDYFVPVEHPDLGEVELPGPPARMSLTPMERPAAPRPLTTELPPREPLSLAGAASRGAPPLAGVRVVDLTAAWLGPYATMLLADLGADVIKVEAPHRPDGWRGAAVVGARSPWSSSPVNPEAHPWNANSNFNSVNRNKRGLALDLTKEEGRRILLDLVEKADILMENFTPRVMANFGLTFDALHERNPRLVMVSFSGYGDSGPYRDYRANGATTDTTCGWASMTGYAGGPPTMMGTMEADPVSGLQMAATALVALAHARRTGQGQHVEGSMLEACVAYVGDEVLLAQVTGENPLRQGNRHRDFVPHGLFACAGDDAWVAIAVRDDHDWAALAAVTGLGDERFSTLAGRRSHVEQIEERLAAWTRDRAAGDVMTSLQAAGVPAGVLQNYTAVLRDPHLRDRQWFQPVDHPDMGRHDYNGFPWRFSATPPVVRKAPPRVGEDSEQVLRTDLALPAPEIARLYDAGVIRTIVAKGDTA